jgi:hypothetical protein
MRQLSELRELFFGAGGMVFLQGVLGKCGDRSWFFCGEIVVDRW